MSYLLFDALYLFLTSCPISWNFDICHSSHRNHWRSIGELSKSVNLSLLGDDA